MKKFIQPLLIFLLVSSFAPGSGAHAHDLLNSPKRPTIAQIIDVYGAHPETNPHEKLLKLDKKFVQAMEDLARLPKIIAFMEKAFPGAIWAPLGRDAVIFGDALDAFYTTIGQPGRVVRLNGSGESIRKVEGPTLVRFLEDAGLDLSRLDRPFVGLDRTSFGVDSQARALLTAVYDAYAERGGKREELVEKVNFLGLTNPSRSNTPGSILAIETIENYRKNTQVSHTVDSILQLDIGGWTDSQAWHKSFESLKIQSDGRFEGGAGRVTSPHNREIVLGQQLWIVQNLSTPQFIEAVEAEAQSLGYSFVKGEQPDLAIRAQALEFRYAKGRGLFSDLFNEEVAQRKAEAAALLEGQARELIQLVDSLTPLTEVQLAESDPIIDVSRLIWRFDFTQNYSVFRQWMTSVQITRLGSGDLLTLHLIEQASRAFGQKKLKVDDFRALVLIGFTLSSQTPPYLEYLGRILNQHPLLREMLVAEESYFSGGPYERPSGYYVNGPLYEKVRSELLKQPVDAEKLNAKHLLERRKINDQAIEMNLAQLESSKRDWHTKSSVANFEIFRGAIQELTWKTEGTLRESALHAIHASIQEARDNGVINGDHYQTLLASCESAFARISGGR